MISDASRQGDRTHSDDGWPALSWEEHDWVTTIPPEMVSAKVRKRHSGSYRSAVVPVIAELTPRLPVAVASLAEEASIEIARFDGELGAEVTPFASVLLRSESASSSLIENLSEVSSD